MADELTFGIATAADEDRICELNYRTFVDEIPQHRPNSSRRLVDRFHSENTYLVARSGDRLVGMVAVRDQRPFSLDEKLPELDRYLPPHQRLCEVRLLSVAEDSRRGPVFAGLMDQILRLGRERGYDLAVVSGTTRQRRLYEHMGFVAFGPKVGAPDARYQPMYLTMSSFVQRSAAAFERRKRVSDTCSRVEPCSFLPGPVCVAPEIRAAMSELASSHRSDAFLHQMHRVREELCALTHAADAAVFLGSGTLANDVVGAQIACQRTPGAIVVDGEFGRRLADHAKRWSIDFELFERPWGSPWSIHELERFLVERPQLRWVWVTLCETSTGVLRDMDGLRGVATALGVELYLDAISAIGAVPVDLRSVRLATAVSGKALGSYAGLAIVLGDRPFSERTDSSVPRYLDPALYAKAQGVAFTQSSNLLGALDTALSLHRSGGRTAHVADLAGLLRRRLRAHGIRTLIPDRSASPAVTTILLEGGGAAQFVGEWLRQRGFLVGFESEYLRARDWIQVCLMGAVTRDSVERLVPRVRQALDAFRDRTTGDPTGASSAGEA
ncbi:MAG: GNAT family N-acetyltransferase [Planctomycetota bacterium]